VGGEVVVLALIAVLAGVWAVFADDPEPRDTVHFKPPRDPNSLVVLLDGTAEPGSGFASSGGQPAVRYLVHEDDGRITHFLFDAGQQRLDFEHNDDVDTSVSQLPQDERGVDFVLFSHLHPVIGEPQYHPDGGGLNRLVQQNPDIPLYMPRVEGLAYEHLPPVWQELSLLDRTVFLDEGFHWLTPKVVVWTIPFEEPVAELTQAMPEWIPLESVLLVSTTEGWFVHSVCAHTPTTRVDGRPVHPVQLLQEAIGEDVGKGPIHTLMTGGCQFGAIGTEYGYEEQRAIEHVLKSLGQGVEGLRRLVLSHCALYAFSIDEATCSETVGVPCELAGPGFATGLVP